MDILTISRRIGHSKPSVTLELYGHLIEGPDAEAVRALDGVLMARWPIGGQFMFCCHRGREQLSDLLRRRRGREAEGGGLLNRYTV
jgi:hypothetical protein